MELESIYTYKIGIFIWDVMYIYVKFEERKFEERYFEITFDEITNTFFMLCLSEIKFRLREVGSIVLLFNVGKK